MDTVAVVGLGYVGLPSALAFAQAGVKTVGYDVDLARLAAIESRDVDLSPEDAGRLARWSGLSRFLLTADPAPLRDADTVIICVPTPVDAHLVPDTTALVAACGAVIDLARPGQTIVLTSTTYVGCTRDLLVAPLAERGLQAGRDVFVAFAPERIDPPNTKYPQEVVPRVVGGVGAESTARAAEALGHIAPIHTVSSPEAAELTKLMENTFRAVNIALANEFADVASELGVDPLEAVEAAASKPFGFMRFYPGPGAGGHCIPCDPHYLLWQLRAHRAQAPIIDAAMSAIAARPARVVTRAREILGNAGRPLAGSRVLVVGVAYKPAVADVRQSPALEIMTRLDVAGASVAYTDPRVPEVHAGGLELASLDDPASEPWDLVVIHTVHPGVDLGWLSEVDSVLDCTYRLTEIPHRQMP